MITTRSYRPFSSYLLIPKPDDRSFYRGGMMAVKAWLPARLRLAAVPACSPGAASPIPGKRGVDSGRPRVHIGPDMISRRETLEDILDRLEQLYQDGRGDEARRELKRARKKFPQDLLLMEWEATFANDDGRYGDALTRLDAVLAAEPGRRFARRERSEERRVGKGSGWRWGGCA